MMFPTTVLSVLAVSAAAENTSSGNRGLRKISTPWTAIGVVSGTAVTGLGIGFVIGWFSNSASADTAAGDSCPLAVIVALTTAGVQGGCTGCAKDYLLTAAKTCAECSGGKRIKAKKGGKNFGDLDGSSGKPWENATSDCEADGCKAGWHQKTTPNACEECPRGQYIAASTTSGVQATCTGCKAGWVQSAGNAAGAGGACTECESGTTVEAAWVDMPTATPVACA